MRVVFVNRFFHPDHSATAQLASDLAMVLVSGGTEVLVVTSRQRYDDAGARLPRRESLNGVMVSRVRGPGFGRPVLAGRLLDYLGFYLGSAWQLFRWLRRGDVVVVMTDPPLISIPVAWVARCRTARVVNWLQDVFPEVAERLEVSAVRPLARPLRWLRRHGLRGAAANVVIGSRMADVIAGDCGTRPTVIPNWALEESLDPEGDRRAAGVLRTAWGLDDAFVVGYSGNMGRSHVLEPLIDAATALRQDHRIVFLLSGDGAKRAALEVLVRQRGLTNVHFRPYQPRSNLRAALALPDVHYVSLDERLEGLVIPSKFVGVIALGRPVLWLGAPEGEVGTLVRESKCGVVVGSHDGAIVAEAIQKMVRDRAELSEMAANAWSLWHRRFQRRAALDAWREVLAGLSTNGSESSQPR
jgi:glycosyltransferase involved in cell wall biosynthesis